MSVIDGLGVFKSLIDDIFSRAGLPADIIADADQWYSQQSWLDAFRIIAEKIGPRTLFRIGQKIPGNAVFPPQINDVHSALQSIDLAYHANHKNFGSEGIGHYIYQKTGEKEAMITCDNPYPCDFDIGIITAMAKKFSHFAKVRHEHVCRKDGYKTCTYTVKW